MRLMTPSSRSFLICFSTPREDMSILIAISAADMEGLCLIKSRTLSELFCFLSELFFVLSELLQINLCSQKHCHICRNIQHIAFFAQVFCVDEIAVAYPAGKFLAESIDGNMRLIARRFHLYWTYLSASRY